MEEHRSGSESGHDGQLDLSQATMANWMIATTRDWLKPLVNRLHELLVQERYLHADETPLQVGHE